MGIASNSSADMLRRLKNRLQRKVLSSRPWHEDLCEYYGVTPQEALELGSRSNGRRPSLPGSPTTHSVTGKSFEDIWDSQERNVDSEIDAFYQDMGAWATFRQIVYHRNNDFHFIADNVKPNFRVCEYGSGVAPISHWLVENQPGVPLHLTIADVPSEHLRFGEWRIRKRIDESRPLVSLEVLEVRPDALPLKGQYDLITIFEVYEHLRNPLEVTVHLCNHLHPGGLLWENYIVQEHAHASDLAIAQEQRPEVFQYLRQNCELLSGKSPDDADGGGTRCWRRLPRA